MQIHIRRYAQVEMHIGTKENQAVRAAAQNLMTDLRKVLDVHTYDELEPALTIEIHILGSTDSAWTCPESLQVSLAKLRNPDGSYRKEGYLIAATESAVLYLLGTDRRGTIYAIYEFSRRVLGVSPWYFMADVPVRRREEILLDTENILVDWPLVEYRGIFINDEEELEHWAQRYLGEETIGYRTYEKVYELLLRLRMNYLWPAMHVNSFNTQRDCAALADRMGIVIGTSHCDMLMRSNFREWEPWLASKGYDGAVYDYSVPGHNRDVLREYWAESVDANRDYECCYTLGMRGIHDSGFETRALTGLTGEELIRAKVDLLGEVIALQDGILRDHLGRETLKTFIPYKEVLDLYDNGLQVPEDVTLIWVNDNYGYVRRYPTPEEQERVGGNGLYYHNSYWAAADDEASYTFITTIPLAHTRNELRKAWENGIRKIWVTNFGAIKPLEMELTYYAGYAWNCGKSYVPEDDEQTWLADWLDETFTGRHGGELADSLLLFDQVTNIRKLELMVPEILSQSVGGDEAAARLHIYEVILSQADAVYDQLPEEERDAFYQMVLMRIHAAYETCSMFYYADRSVHDMAAGKAADAQRAYDTAQAYRRLRAALLWYYNHEMRHGKWNGILTPDDFPPPRAAIHPPMQRPLAPAADRFIVTLPNQDGVLAGTGLRFIRPVTKWMELANAGTKRITVSISVPAWINLYGMEHEEDDTEADMLEDPDGRKMLRLSIEKETRILVETDWCAVDLHPQTAMSVDDEIVLYCEETDETVQIPVRAMLAANARVPAAGGVEALFDHMEDDGMVCIEAVSAHELEQVREANQRRRTANRTMHTSLCDPGDGTGWNVIPHLGRMRGSLVEARESGRVLTYDFTVTGAVSDDYILEIHRFPTLNSTGEISIEVSVDEQPYRRLLVEANDSYRGNWLPNAKDGVDRMCLELPGLAAGSHVLRLRAVQSYFAFSRLVIYAQGVQRNNLGLQFYDEYFARLPEELDVESFARRYYGEQAWQGETLPTVYLNYRTLANGNRSNNYYAMPGGRTRGANTRPFPGDAGTPAAENGGVLTIEPAMALLENEMSWTEAGAASQSTVSQAGHSGWLWADAPTHAGDGLSLYLRTEGDVCERIEDAPSLHYRIRVDGGSYRIWVRVLFWGRQSDHFTISMDGSIIPVEECYLGASIWSYSAENVWEWVPLYAMDLEEGEHEIGVHLMSGMTRISQIYLSRNGNRPPAEG